MIKNLKCILVVDFPNEIQDLQFSINDSYFGFFCELIKM